MTVLRVPKAFPTIAAAVAAAAPGDTILVRPGVYRETVRISTDFIRLIAQRAPVILDGQGRRNQAFLIKGAQGVEINGFIIRDYLRAGILVQSGRFNRLVHNVIKRITGGEGIRVESDGNLIWDNRVVRASGDGILLVNADGNWAVENRTIRNGGRGIFVLGGKYSALVGNETRRNANFGLASTGDNTLILKNRSVEDGELPGETDSAPEGAAEESTGNAVLIQNRFLRNRLPGISITRRNIFVARNLVRENRGTGIRLGPTARFNSIEENCVFNNQENGIQVDGTKNLILRNKARRNVPFDLVLNNPDNDVIKNECRSSNPPGLCE